MKKPAQKTTPDSISVPNRTAFLEKVRDFIIASLERTGLDDRTKHLMVLAIDEAVTSNILFSVETGREGMTKVSVDVNSVRMKVVIEDTGRDLDSADLTEAVMQETYTKARKHEMGIFLIRQIVDEISYAFKKGFENQLTLVKFLE